MSKETNSRAVALKERLHLLAEIVRHYQRIPDREVFIREAPLSDEELHRLFIERQVNTPSIENAFSESPKTSNITKVLRTIALETHLPREIHNILESERLDSAPAIDAGNRKIKDLIKTQYPAAHSAVVLEPPKGFSAQEVTNTLGKVLGLDHEKTKEILRDLGIDDKGRAL